MALLNWQFGTLFHLAKQQLFLLGMPFQKLMGSKFTGKAEEGSARLTEHMIKQYFLQFHPRSRQSENIIGGILDKEFKMFSSMVSTNWKFISRPFGGWAGGRQLT